MNRTHVDGRKHAAAGFVATARPQHTGEIRGLCNCGKRSCYMCTPLIGRRARVTK